MKIATHAQEDELSKIVEHVGDMTEELLKKNFFRNTAPDAWQPAMNIYETQDCYVVCLELAGMDRDKIDVRTGERVLYIRGDRPRPALKEPADHVSVQLMEIDSENTTRNI